MIDAHPFAPFGWRSSLFALAVTLSGWAIWRAWPTPFLADLTALLAAYAMAVGMLEPARRWQHGAVLAGWTALSLTLGGSVGGWVAGWLHGKGNANDAWHGHFSAIATAVLCVLILPGLLRRWLGWRESRLLAAQAERLGAERALLEARLAALQGQIEPHFLYNTLANVQYLLRHDGERADQMLSRLIAYLRAAVPELRQGETTLGQELARMQAYLDIMAIRMGDRLQYHIDCPAELAFAVLPPLAIATLVENALKHGLEAKPGGGRIDIAVQRSGNEVSIAVSDDGVGFSETGSGSGVGLRNLGERLAMLFGQAASLSLEARPGGGVRALLRLPLRFAATDHTGAST
jgi:two-component sensor histidine kinase